MVTVRFPQHPARLWSPTRDCGDRRHPCLSLGDRGLPSPFQASPTHPCLPSLCWGLGAWTDPVPLPEAVPGAGGLGGRARAAGMPPRHGTTFGAVFSERLPRGPPGFKPAGNTQPAACAGKRSCVRTQQSAHESERVKSAGRRRDSETLVQAGMVTRRQAAFLTGAIVRCSDAGTLRHGGATAHGAAGARPQAWAPVNALSTQFEAGRGRALSAQGQCG